MQRIQRRVAEFVLIRAQFTCFCMSVGELRPFCICVQKGESYMLFANEIVPGGERVEIMQITNLDGTPIAGDNWRHKLVGRVTLCWSAGDFHCRGAFLRDTSEL